MSEIPRIKFLYCFLGVLRGFVLNKKGGGSKQLLLPDVVAEALKQGFIRADVLSQS